MVLGLGVKEPIDRIQTLRQRSGVIVKDMADCRLSHRVNRADNYPRQGDRHVWIGSEGGIVFGLNFENTGSLASFDQDIALVGGDDDVLATLSGTARNREKE